MKQTEAFSIGALSGRSGVHIETVRYYEQIGIMPAPARSAGGYRIYGTDHVRRLHFIRRGRELGFSLDELRGLLHLVDGQSYTCREVNALAVGHLATIRQKIADLQRLEHVMSDMAKQCKGNQVPDCPIIDALFEMRPVAHDTAHTRVRAERSSKNK